MRVLYVNHTSEISGAERSLMDLLRSVGDRVEVVVACPPGRLAQTLRSSGVQWQAITGTAGSLRLHPRHTPEALGELAAAAWQVRGLTRKLGIDVVHANSIRAGLITAGAAALGAPRPVVHLRDILPEGPLTTVTFGVLTRGSGVLVANSALTAGQLGVAAQRTRVRVVHNPIDLSRFDPARVNRSAQRAALGLTPGQFAAAVVAQLTPWKGQDDAIRAIALVKAAHPGVRLLIVGKAMFVDRATRFDNHAYVEQLRALVERLDLSDTVTFLGDRDDVPDIMGACDAVLLPSWEEPFGRAVAEGMALGLPVIATSIGGPAEMISDGENGLLLAPRQPQRWAQGLSRLIEDEPLRRRLGARARAWALVAFDADTHARAILDIYAEAVRGGAAAPDRLKG